MKINSKVLGLIILITFIGGIAISAALGYWNTESSGGGGAGTGSEAIEGGGATSTDGAFVRGKTTFQDLIDLGLSRDAIEEVLGGPMPDPMTRVKDHCATQGLDFETVKTELEAEIQGLDQ